MHVVGEGETQCGILIRVVMYMFQRERKNAEEKATAITDFLFFFEGKGRGGA